MCQYKSMGMGESRCVPVVHYHHYEGGITSHIICNPGSAIIIHWIDSFRLTVMTPPGPDREPVTDTCCLAQTCTKPTSI